MLYLFLSARLSPRHAAGNALAVHVRSGVILCYLAPLGGYGLLYLDEVLAADTRLLQSLRLRSGYLRKPAVVRLPVKDDKVGQVYDGHEHREGIRVHRGTEKLRVMMVFNGVYARARELAFIREP